MISPALLLRSLLALAAALLLQFVVVFDLLSQFDQAQTRDRMNNSASALATAASPALLSHDLVGLQVLSQSFLRPPLQSLLITDAHGESLSLSGHDEHVEHHLQQSIIEQGQLLGYARLGWNDRSADTLSPALWSSLGLIALIDSGLMAFWLLAGLRSKPEQTSTSPASAEPEASVLRDTDLSCVHVRIDLPALHSAEHLGPDAEALENELTCLGEIYGGQLSGQARQGYALEFSDENRIERQWKALQCCIAALSWAHLHPQIQLKASLAHGRQARRGELIERSARLSHSAPLACALLDEQDMLPLLAQRAVISQRARMELGRDMGVHKVLCVQKLQAEYQSLLDRRLAQSAQPL